MITSTALSIALDLRFVLRITNPKACMVQQRTSSVTGRHLGISLQLEYVVLVCSAASENKHRMEYTYYN
jgi:hypothetical protein